MNKFSIYGLAAIFAFSFAACDNYEEPNPAPQTNPQESVLQTSNIQVGNSLEATPYDLLALNDSNTPIEVARFTASELPATFSMLSDVQISNNGFAKAIDVRSTVSRESTGEYVVKVNPDDLQGAYESGISKSPKEAKIEVRFLLKTEIGKQIAYVGGPTNFYGPYEMTIVPMPSDFVIEENYYLVGTINGWSVAEGVKFNHSGMSQYDDPVFTLKVDITPDEAAAGWWWKIVPESTYATGGWVDAVNASFGPVENGDEAMSGMIAGRTETIDSGAGCIKESGQFLLTINLEECTYEFSSAVDYLYTPGNSNGWSQVDSQMLFTTDYANYSGFAHLNGEFKFTNSPDWSHVNYGNSGEEGKLSTDSGAGNLSVPEDGLYFCEANTASLTYSTTLISTIGIIGDATPKGWDASTALTSEDFLVWKGTVELKGGEFKFRCNDEWTINLGGDMENLSYNGANIPSPGEGTYEVTLNLGMLPYSCSVVKK